MVVHTWKSCAKIAHWFDLHPICVRAAIVGVIVDHTVGMEQRVPFKCTLAMKILHPVVIRKKPICVQQCAEQKWVEAYCWHPNVKWASSGTNSDRAVYCLKSSNFSVKLHIWHTALQLDHFNRIWILTHKKLRHMCWHAFIHSLSTVLLRCFCSATVMYLNSLTYPYA